MIFNELYFCKFLSYISNQVVKKYLLDQENSLACTIWSRAWLRAKKPRPRSLLCWKFPKKNIFSQSSLLALRARATTRAHVVHTNRFSWTRTRGWKKNFVRHHHQKFEGGGGGLSRKIFCKNFFFRKKFSTSFIQFLMCGTKKALREELRQV